jgi:hypothetical protein
MLHPDEHSADMPTEPVRRPISPATWYALLLLAVLGLSVWAPIGSASRTARAESRGEQLARIVLEEASLLMPTDLRDPLLPPLLLGRTIAAALRDGVFVEDLEVVENRNLEGVTLANKHYFVQLRWSASADERVNHPHAGREPALEVLAWPLDPAGPAHAVFFYPEDAEPAYTRNLSAGYVGADPQHWPKPAQAHRRNDGGNQIWHYRGFDDERWLLVDRPRRKARA